LIAKTSSGNFGTKKYNVIIDEIPNTPPKFTKIVGPIFGVKLVKGVDGELEDDSTETYTSPKAVDAQKDKIIMSFTGGKVFMRMKKNDDDTFFIKINKSLLPKKTATYAVSIGLEDVRGAKQIVRSRMKVMVEYQDKYKEAKEAAEKAKLEAEKLEKEEAEKAAKELKEKEEAETAEEEKDGETEDSKDAEDSEKSETTEDADDAKKAEAADAEETKKTAKDKKAEVANEPKKVQTAAKEEVAKPK